MMNWEALAFRCWVPLAARPPVPGRRGNQQSIDWCWDVIRCDDGLVRPGPGGRYLPNAFGLHDMYGNVSEWVLDCGLPSYEDAPNDGSPAEEGAGCTSHGIRGGSWDSMAIEAKSAYRNTASNANDDRGIRLVREL